MAKQAVIHVAQVKRHGEALVVPESMTAKQAIEVLTRQVEYEEQQYRLHEVFDKAFIFDGAYALQKALAQKFGWVGGIPTPGFWGPNPPAMLGVAISPTEMVQVPWGRMAVPGIEGYFETSLQPTNEGRMVFALGGVVKRKHERQVNEIVKLVHWFLEHESIYRGRAVRIRFRYVTTDHANGHMAGDVLPMPEPKFMDLSNVRESELIYSESVARAIQASLFTPIERADDCRNLGVPLKRGILLAGPYGVGKTLAAYVAAHKAEKSGWTFVYCETSPELQDAIRFAQQYAPAVVFCEDIDRVASGERDLTMDDLLAIVDGIESKNTELLVVLTTNEPSKIQQAMLRPGRLDAIINVTPPDAEAVVRLISLYARGLVPSDEDLSAVGEKLSGQIPAVIRECVERSKLHALRLSQPGEEVRITTPALLAAADEMAFALNLLAAKKEDERSDIEKAADRLGEHLTRNGKALDKMPVLP